tara:strand:- start:3694 stop:3948 length:255 start_codon:yes stop_codon:yes gene_type:complete
MRLAGITLCALAGSSDALQVGFRPHTLPRVSPRCVASLEKPTTDKISAEEPLHVLIAGAGVGGLALANSLELQSKSHVKYTVLE